MLNYKGRNDTISPVRQNSCSPVIENTSTKLYDLFQKTNANSIMARQYCQKVHRAIEDIWADWNAERSKCPFSAFVGDILGFLPLQCGGTWYTQQYDCTNYVQLNSMIYLMVCRWVNTEGEYINNLGQWIR